MLMAFALEGCRMSSPKGILGVEWGEEAAAVASRLGVVCGSGWKPWEGHADFEACQDLEHAVTLFGRPAYVRLFRQGAVLEGLALRFEHCDAGRQELAQKTRELFHLDEKESVYRVWADGAAVHLAADRRDVRQA